MRITGLVVLLMSCAAAAGAQTTGSQPDQLFESGVSARALGMGSAFTAVADDASSLYYNPAGLGLISGRRLEAMHASLYGGAAFDYLGYGQNLPRTEGGWGVEVLRLSIGGIEVRDANDNQTGTIGYSDLGVGAGFGLADVLIDDLSLGVGFKGESRSLASVSSRLFGIDAGAQYGPFWNEKITAGLTLTNLASVAQGDTSDKLTPGARLGAAYQVAPPFLLAADISQTGDLRAGAEYRYNAFALRGGWTSGGPTFGGGVLIQDALAFDVAVLDSPTLGVSERISLGYRFGAFRTKTHSSTALNRLIEGIDELAKRDYVEAGGLFDSAVADEPAVGRKPRIDGGGWKRKSKRLRLLLDGLDLAEHPERQEELRAPTVMAELTEKAVQALVADRLDDAMMLAQVAAGEAPRDSIYARLPLAMSKAAGKPLDRAGIMPLGAFVSDRMRRTNDAFYAHRYSAAVEYCRQVTLVAPESALAWERLGSAYFKAGKMAEAEASYRRSMALDPKNRKLKDFLEAHFGK
jgi:tetratricopeptide (TPR) repeat protein